MIMIMVFILYIYYILKICNIKINKFFIEIVYSFSENGHIIVYDTTTNPALIKKVWKVNGMKLT